MDNLIEIEQYEGEPRIDSRLISSELENEHKNVIEMIRKYKDRLEKYGKVTFETAPLKNSGTNQSVTVCYLNEQQSTFLVTLSKNSDRAVGLKQKLNDGFYYYRSKVRSLALPDFTNPAEAAEAWATEYRAKEKAEKELSDAQPKIEFHDQVGDSEGLYTIGEAAKTLGFGRNTLFKMLREAKIFFRREPYQKYINQGYFKVNTTVANDYIQK